MDYLRALNGSDYTIIELYEKNTKKINELKATIESKKNEITELGKKIATYDYDIPQVPDPQYDLLCKLPEFFKQLSSKLLRAKKASIERMMRDQLNLNLVVYAGYIGRVELSAESTEDISFKIYHKDGNEIYISQLNAGAKQTVMQVLLKVLYNLGDYEPPVMIDTVMGVLDKESREVILERYFPDLAHQTILLSTDTEITTERDFEKIQAYVAKTYTLHRDKANQCTTITEDYFGLRTQEY
jgi:DNA sulfur modification protein DndD